MAVTPADVKTAKPQFADVPDATVQAYIDLAERFVDTSWLPGDYQQAVIAMTCHLMTLDGLGSDAESKAQASGSAGYQTIKSGQLTLTRFRSEAEESMGYLGWLAQTSCGRFFGMLLRLNRGGPLVIRHSVGCISPYAKDWPPEYDA